MGNIYSGVKEAMRGPYPHPPGLFFERRLYKKTYSVYPIMCLMIADIIYATSMSCWMYCTRDIVIDRSKKPINERMDLLRPYYLRLVVQSGDDLRPAPDLHAAYKAMKEADEEKKKSQQ